MDQKDKRNDQEIGVKPDEMLTDEELNQVAGGDEGMGHPLTSGEII